MDESRAHQMALPAGYQLDQYRIETELGHGGFGITYRALDTHLDREVAIKEYLPRELAYREAGSTVRPISRGEQELFEWGLERFLDEGRTLAKLDHPAIIRVHSLFRANETAYLVMEYCEGEPLDRVLEREGRLSPERVQSVAETLLSALETLHGQDVIHRDIKPANIFLRSDGSPVLLDFGSARQALGSQSRSVTAVVSAGYAPIEQYSTTSRQGPWTDLYGLGATLYRCVTGVTPPEASARTVEDGLRPSVEVVAGQYPNSLLESIDAALVLQPGQRLQSVAQWRRLMAQSGSAQGAESIPPRKDPDGGESALRGGPGQPGGVGKKRLFGWAAAAVLMVSAGGVGFYQYEEAQAEDERLWSEADEAESLEAYEEYLAGCEERWICDYETDAREAVEEQEEELAAAEQEDERLWTNAQEAGTQEAYEDYLAGCPERLACEHEADAEQALARLQEREEAREEDERLWSEAQDEESIEGYEEYLAGCDDRQICQYESDAQAAIAEEEEELAAAEDERLWSEAQEADSIEAYEEYLADCEDRLICEHESAAQEELDSFIGHGYRYRDNGDGTVTDRETGLMWMRCSLGQTWREGTCKEDADRFDWNEAKDQEGHRFAGYDDWRLPEIEELKGLVYCSSGEPSYRDLSHRLDADWEDRERCEGDYDSPTIDEIAFPNTPASIFRSASPLAGYSNLAWNVNFRHGDDHWTTKGRNNRVRLVRGGQ